MTIKQSWIDNANSKTNMLEYQKWFDDCSSLEDCVKNGFIDFVHKIFTIDLYISLGNPKNKKCLEVGCGGGRLLNAASRFFDSVYGVDILKDMSKTEQFLRQQGCDKFKLVHRDNVNIIPDKSIDFIYSFIVFQHFDSWSESEYYFDFIDRVLSKNGIGIVYFGRSDGDDIKIVKEKDFVKRGCSLYVSEKFASDYISQKFKIIEIGETTKTPWTTTRSGQFYVKFKR